DDTPVFKIEGGVSLPLTETVSARIAVKTHQRDDWIDNEIKNGRGPQTEEGLDGVNEFAGRTTLVWTPSERFDAVFRATIGRRDGDHVPLHFEALDNPASFVRHGGFNEDPAIDVVSQDRPSPEKVEYENVSLHLNWDLDWGSITSISGFIHALYNQDADVDGTPRDGLFGPFEADSDQFSQEFRVAVEATDTVDLIFGAYFFTEDMNGFNWFLTGADLGPNAQFAGCCENSGFGNIEQRERNSYAAFASIDYQISDTLNLAAGVRYTNDEEDWAFQQLFWVFEGSRFNDGVPDSNSAVELFDSGTLSESWDEITGDISLTYSLSDDINLYGKFARGYLSGNHVLPFTGTFFSVVEPEQIDSFELGAKGTYLDGRLQINAAIFDYDYENVQVQRGTTEPTQGGFISVRENAAAATVRGVEFDLTFLPSENWLLRAGGGYTNAEFDEFLSQLPGGGFEDFAGFEFPNVPEITGYVDVRYNVPLANGASLELATDWNYADDYFVDLNYIADNIGESRTIGNAYLRYHSPDEDWTLSLFARNVADKEYVVNRRDFANALEGNLVIYGTPRVLGLSLGMNF
ncbi:MAG: TonB-dependent receptor, partial [Pseudomonadota bacterium]